MILLSLSLAVLCLLSIWSVGSATDCGDRQTEINGQCCDLCPPGKYLKSFCSENESTVCGPCEEGYYMEHYNVFDRCEECKSCQQAYAEKCTLTTNAKCMCHSGFLCSNNACSNCVENKCVTGEKLIQTANPLDKGVIEYSYHCQPKCNDDAYFDAKEEVCKPRTQCSKLGLAERTPGNKTQDSVCEGPEFFQVVLGIGFILLSLSLLVFLSYVCIKKTMKNKQYNSTIDFVAVSTNNSSVHLSKEESRPKLIIQDEYNTSYSSDLG